jgi:hypothetical protein
MVIETNLEIEARTPPGQPADDTNIMKIKMTKAGKQPPKTKSLLAAPVPAPAPAQLPPATNQFMDIESIVTSESESEFSTSDGDSSSEF